MNKLSLRRIKIKIAQFFSFLPDSLVLKIQYRIKTRRKLDLANPKRYTEKLQCYKLCYKNPILKKCVDKYNVREFVASKGLESILNECYGVFDKPELIDFSVLPEKFVCKDTLGSGSNSVIVVDKQNCNTGMLRQLLRKWVNEPINCKHPGREWPYDNQKHRIIIERYLEQYDGDLADYKFFCFDGQVECFYVRTEYAKDHKKGKMAFFNRQKEILKGVEMDYCKGTIDFPPLPTEVDTMIEYAEILSKDFPHVRVDFYNVDGNIIFGELTFFNASGFMTFTPDDFDYELGRRFNISGKRGRKCK